VSICARVPPALLRELPRIPPGPTGAVGRQVAPANRRVRGVSTFIVHADDPGPSRCSRKRWRRPCGDAIAAHSGGSDMQQRSHGCVHLIGPSQFWPMSTELGSGAAREPTWEPNRSVTTGYDRTATIKSTRDGQLLCLITDGAGRPIEIYRSEGRTATNLAARILPAPDDSACALQGDHEQRGRADWLTAATSSHFSAGSGFFATSSANDRQRRMDCLMECG
jgi:hypothetical protein